MNETQGNSNQHKARCFKQFLWSTSLVCLRLVCLKTLGVEFQRNVAQPFFFMKLVVNYLIMFINYICLPYQSNKLKMQIISIWLISPNTVEILF